ncbi:Endonuclease/exonuclease/phosphatase family protein [Myxococcus hansupus]|uniref:Endonuclease/exonuclease/phosphatase family protein n=2 Tax=Pseudomyxococcus hansupus TaxID=1297742 RepID=A0A0H4WIZ8_9BACT|nr:Endonuclease/exonuclease/phosphatase family protein [Myxococcus hansupus]
MAGMLAVLTLLSACDGRGTTVPPQLPAVELSPTTVGLDYEAMFTASGGEPPLRYTVTPPPPGFSFFTGEGRLLGPGSEAGDFSITVTVRDANGTEHVRTYALRVWARPEVTSATLPIARTGGSYEHVLVATGGRPPLEWEVVEGALPTGIELHPDGLLNGQPQGEGNYPVTLRVKDAHGAEARVQLGLQVLAPGETPDGGAPDGGPHEGTFPLSVANWNIEWFGDPQNGPTNEPLQLSNVQAVIADAGVDIWGLAEIVNTAQFNELKARLPGYDGFLADDGTRVSSGTSYYGANDQKVGVLFKSDVVQVLRADVVMLNQSWDFGGRPPLRVDLRILRPDGASVDVTALILHMKAYAGAADYARRLSASSGLKDYLDLRLPTQRVMVIGDWNDDVDESIATNPDTGRKFESPYRNFVSDTARYSFTTEALSRAGVGSTTSHSSFISHQLVSNEMWDSYVPNSARVLRPNISGYRNNTSDHYPIISRFNFGQPDSGGPRNGGSQYPVFINEYLPQTGNVPGTSTPDYDRQFVELVNGGTTAVDLGGWKIHDANSQAGSDPVRHVFPAGTMIHPGKSYVVYSGPTAVPLGATNATSASGGGLYLNRGVNQGSSGDTVFLVRPDNTVQDSAGYQDTTVGISYNRSPDGSATGTWVPHTQLQTGLQASPGQRAVGAEF